MNKKQVIRINENQLEQIVMESVKRIVKESEYDFQTYKHVKDDGTKLIVTAAFIDYTFCFKEEKLGEFDTIEEAKTFVSKIANDKDYIYDLVDNAYAEMEEDDETNISSIILEIYKDYGNRGLYAIGNGVRVYPRH